MTLPLDIAAVLERFASVTPSPVDDGDGVAAPVVKDDDVNALIHLVADPPPTVAVTAGSGDALSSSSSTFSRTLLCAAFGAVPVGLETVCFPYCPCLQPSDGLERDEQQPDSLEAAAGNGRHNDDSDTRSKKGSNKNSSNVLYIGNATDLFTLRELLRSAHCEDCPFRDGDSVFQPLFSTTFGLSSTDPLRLFPSPPSAVDTTSTTTASSSNPKTKPPPGSSPWLNGTNGIVSQQRFAHEWLKLADAISDLDALPHSSEVVAPQEDGENKTEVENGETTTDESLLLHKLYREKLVQDAVTAGLTSLEKYDRSLSGSFPGRPMLAALPKTATNTNITARDIIKEDFEDEEEGDAKPTVEATGSDHKNTEKERRGRLEKEAKRCSLFLLYCGWKKGSTAGYLRCHFCQESRRIGSLLKVSKVNTTKEEDNSDGDEEIVLRDTVGSAHRWFCPCFSTRTAESGPRTPQYHPTAFAQKMMGFWRGLDALANESVVAQSSRRTATLRGKRSRDIIELEALDSSAAAAAAAAQQASGARSSTTTISDSSSSSSVLPMAPPSLLAIWETAQAARLDSIASQKKDNDDIQKLKSLSDLVSKRCSGNYSPSSSGGPSEGRARNGRKEEDIATSQIRLHRALEAGGVSSAMMLPFDSSSNSKNSNHNCSNEEQEDGSLPDSSNLYQKTQRPSDQQVAQAKAQIERVLQFMSSSSATSTNGSGGRNSSGPAKKSGAVSNSNTTDRSSTAVNNNTKQNPAKKKDVHPSSAPSSLIQKQQQHSAPSPTTAGGGKKSNAAQQKQPIQQQQQQKLNPNAQPFLPTPQQQQQAFPSAMAQQQVFTHQRPSVNNNNSSGSTPAGAGGGLLAPPAPTGFQPQQHFGGGLLSQPWGAGSNLGNNNANSAPSGGGLLAPPAAQAQQKASTTQQHQKKNEAQNQELSAAEKRQQRFKQQQQQQGESPTGKGAPPQAPAKGKGGKKQGGKQQGGGNQKGGGAAPHKPAPKGGGKGGKARK